MQRLYSPEELGLTPRNDLLDRLSAAILRSVSGWHTDGPPTYLRTRAHDLASALAAEGVLCVDANLLLRSDALSGTTPCGDRSPSHRTTCPECRTFTERSLRPLLEAQTDL